MIHLFLKLLSKDAHELKEEVQKFTWVQEICGTNHMTYAFWQLFCPTTFGQNFLVTCCTKYKREYLIFSAQTVMK